MALILVNIAKLNGERLEEKPIVTRAIKDYDSISSSRTDAVKKAYANGLIIGDENGNFNPNKSLTRAEVATVFCRVMKYTRRPVAEGAPKKLIVWSYTDEFHRILRKYQEFHPDQNIEFGGGIIGTPFYQEFLDKEFASSGPETPDIYTVDSSFALKYTKGDASQYAATYKELGIEVDRLLKEAEIAQYTVDIGTRPSDREIVALSYQGTAGACIYRRSIAKDVWGTDDPQIIKNKIGPDWEKFFKAAEELKAKDYGIVSSDRDIWNVIEGSSPTGWIVNGKLNIDPSREKFIDYAKQIKDNGWSNNTDTWSSPWYDDMMDDNEQKVFCYFGPAWFINYCLVPSSFSEYKPNIEGTYGDWAVCEPPANFFWSGSWVLASKNNIDKDAVGDILKWITLDSSNTGLQYLKANGFTIDRETEAKDAVPSATVMRKSNGKLDFLDGQDMFDVFIPANASVSGENKTEYDEVINTYWLSVIREYMDGEITRSQVIPRFEIMVSDNQIIVD
jgi:hypothetical protein